MSSGEPERHVMLGDASAKVRCLKCFGFFSSGEHACKSDADQQTEYDAAEAAAAARLALAEEQTISVVLKRGGDEDDDGAVAVGGDESMHAGAGAGADEVHGGEDPAALVFGSLSSGKWRYECTVCGKRFRRPYGLQRHSKVHRDERPFSCPQCGLCVRQQYRLNEHMRTHTEDPSFPCTACSKVYTRKDHLQRHARKVHGGELDVPSSPVVSAKPTPTKQIKKKKTRVNVKGSKAVATKVSNSHPGPVGVAPANESVDPFDFDSQNPPDQA